MEDALDSMYDLITGKSEYISDCPDFSPQDNILVQDNAPPQDSERAAIDELLGIQPPVVEIEPRPIMIEVYPFDPESNMVNPIIRENFRTETIFRETDMFTAPVITTITMEGFLSNIRCHEEELITDLQADEQFVKIKCNFGEKIYPGYQPPKKVKKSNRGRKKKPPKERKRKRQGTGECFNSQTTFVMPSSDVVPVDGIVPSDSLMYKFKVFRTGKLQLPGLLTTTVIDDVMILTQRLVGLLNFHLHTCECDYTKITRLINLNPVMKNYKFVVKLTPGWIIDLAKLRELLQRDRSADNPARTFDIKYTRQETKLSVRFTTPVTGNQKKKVRVNIFKSGKVNILGGHSKESTDAICEYLHDLFVQNSATLITKLGCADEQLEDNLEILAGHAGDIIPVPKITVSIAEYLLAMDIIDQFHRQFMNEANRELESLLECTV